jgi:enterochelin esterase-like enzyme
MKRAGAICFALLVVTFFLSCPIANCAGEVKLYEIPSKTSGTAPGKLSVYLPEDYSNAEASYPVLYLIHGATGNNLTFLGGGYDGWMSDANASVIAERLIQEKKIKPLIVVCPDLSDAVILEDYPLLDVVSFVDATFRTIPSRESRAIAGHSMGGFFSFSMGLEHPEIFGIVGGFSSSSLQVLDLDRLVEEHDLNSYPMRFWLYEGTRDGGTQVHKNFVETLKKHGFPAAYQEDEGDHTSRVAQRLGEFIEYISNYLKW